MLYDSDLQKRPVLNNLEYSHTTKLLKCMLSLLEGMPSLTRENKWFTIADFGTADAKTIAKPIFKAIGNYSD